MQRGIDTSQFAQTINLAKLKSDLGGLDIDKLKPVSVNLSKLSKVVKNNVVRKDMYDESIKKINSEK